MQSSPDHLRLDLEIWTHIGVPEDERRTEQRVLVGIGISGYFSRVMQTDDLKHGVNYADIAREIRALSETPRRTIERFADEIANQVSGHENVRDVTVTVTKMPKLPGVRSASITLHRP